MVKKTKHKHTDHFRPSTRDTPLDPADYFVAAIRLTQVQGGSDYYRMLGGARRCLDEFTLPLPLTDFRLMHHSDRAEFLACIEEKFLGTYRRDNVLLLPAFPAHDYSNRLYWECYLATLDDVAAEFRECITKLQGPKRVSSRTLTDVLYSTERFIHYFEHPQMPHYHALLLKVRQGKKTDSYRQGAAKLMGQVMRALEKEYNTLRHDLENPDDD